MKKIYFYTLFLITTICGAQVGIGTITPQKELHVAGVNSTIRIEKLDSTNNTYNNGGLGKLYPAFVDGNGDINLGSGIGSNGIEPINFLIEVPNFIPDDPYGLGLNTGSVVNSNDLGETTVEGQITSIPFTVPQDALIEVKYGITMFITSNDLTLGCPCTYVTYDQAVVMQTYFVIDIDSDGLSGAELAKKYGIKGQYYATNYGGSAGYPYMNGQGYLTLPAGSHTMYFYGIVNDHANYYTSIGFGGAQDYLKIRVYN